MTPDRRHSLKRLGLALAAPWPALAAVGSTAPALRDAAAALQAGAAVLVMRHALAPGTFDPPGFRLGDCGTQRNLSEEGRQQAQRTGAWLTARGLRPSRVRSSPWCRCVDTAQLAFGQAEVWAPLSSPSGSDAALNAQHLQALRQALVEASAQPGQWQAWVTHQFVMSALVGGGAESGEGLVLQADAGGAPRVLARLAPQ